MPKIKWLGLPPQLRQHLFDRAKERKITLEDLFAWRSGVGIPQTFRMALGIKTLGRSSSAEKDHIRRLSF